MFKYIEMIDKLLAKFLKFEFILFIWMDLFLFDTPRSGKKRSELTTKTTHYLNIWIPLSEFLRFLGVIDSVYPDIFWAGHAGMSR